MRACLEADGIAVANQRHPRITATAGTLVARGGTYSVYVLFAADDKEADELEDEARDAAAVQPSPDQRVYREANVVYFSDAVEFPHPMRQRIRSCLRGTDATGAD